MVRAALLIAMLVILGACSSFGQPIAEPTWASCDKAPSQQSLAERNYCAQRSRGGG